MPASNQPTNLRYRGDLWGSTRQQRDGIARVAFGDQLDYVLNLGSGLYFTAVLTDGTHWNIGDARAHAISISVEDNR